MSTTIRARVRNGKLEPIDPVDLPEGAEVRVTIEYSRRFDRDMVPLDRAPDFEAFLSSFGGWKGLLDFDAFLQGLRDSRKIVRPEVRL